MNSPDLCFDTKVPRTWCPGCGNFALLDALKDSFRQLALAPHQITISSGIGQAAKVPHYIKCNGFNGLHGRAIPVAAAAKLAAPDQQVLVHAGDGDCYGEGCNHLIHGIRRNVDLTVIVHDNRIYGLTKGQSSPTTAFGQPTTSEQGGVRARPLNPLALALSQRCSFVAQAFTGNRAQLSDIIVQAMLHKGFSLINVLQPCVSFNKVHTFQWFKQQSIELPDDWDDGDLQRAFALVTRADERLPLGILFRQGRPTFDELLRRGSTEPLRDRPLEPARALALLDRFR